MVKKHGYPLATGHMAEVWAKLECPVCDGELDHVTDEYEDDLHLDTYTCEYCNLFVTYISPERIHEYKDVPDSKRWYSIEGRL